MFAYGLKAVLNKLTFQVLDIYLTLTHVLQNHFGSSENLHQDIDILSKFNF